MNARLLNNAELMLNSFAQMKSPLTHATVTQDGPSVFQAVTISVSTMTSVLTARTTAVPTPVALPALTPSLVLPAAASRDTLEMEPLALMKMSVPMELMTAVIQVAR